MDIFTTKLQERINNKKLELSSLFKNKVTNKNTKSSSQKLSNIKQNEQNE